MSHLPRHAQHPSSKPSLRRLIAGIDEVVHGSPGEHLEAIAALTAEAVSDPLLLPPAFRQSFPDRIRTNVVHVADDGSFSVVALVWLPGQRTSIHSHRSWCVIGVHEGEELETSYELLDQPGPYRLRQTSTRRSGPGSVSWLGSTGNVHHVENDGQELAVSIHIYGVDYRRFGSSILDEFDPSTVAPTLTAHGSFRRPRLLPPR